MSFNDGAHNNYLVSKKSGYSSAGRLERLLRVGHFAVTAELASPDSENSEEAYARNRVSDNYVNGMNATDGFGANCHMPSVSMCAQLSQEGYETVMKISC